MKILITGATGFIGKHIVKKLLAQGHDIHILSRNPEKSLNIFPHKNVTFFKWDNNLELPPVEAIHGIHGVIHLMGENIGAKRWSVQQKKILKESRVDSTKNLVALIEKNYQGVLDFFISASAIGIYSINKSEVLTEESRPAQHYLAQLSSEWESASESLTKTKRRVLLRTSVVLEKKDGALKKMLLPFQLGLGGPIGDGNQMMSWIHLEDLVNLYIAAVNDPQYNGIYNATSPYPVCNFDFTKALGSALHRPTIFPVPALALKLALGEMSGLILDSQAVVSSKLTTTGFQFTYPHIEEALTAIFAKKSS